MKRGAFILLALAGTFSLSGCNFLRCLFSHCRIGMRMELDPYFGTTRVRPDGSCDSGVLRCFSSGAVTINLMEWAIKNGFSIAAFDECGDFCSDPESPGCDTCRSTVGAAILQPFVTACQGTAYQPLPDRVLLNITAVTNIGERTSPAFSASKDSSRVRWDDCGGQSADYVLPENEVQAWARGLVDSGARTATEFRVNTAGAGGRPVLFQLKEGYNLKEAGSAALDPRVWGVGMALWGFNGQGSGPLFADGVKSELMLPLPSGAVDGAVRFSGVAQFAIQP